MLLHVLVLFLISTTVSFEQQGKVKSVVCVRESVSMSGIERRSDGPHEGTDARLSKLRRGCFNVPIYNESSSVTYEPTTHGGAMAGA